MYCNKCGKEIDDEALICPYCGCGTVNYIRDQAKAESRARSPASLRRRSARLRCCSVSSSAASVHIVFMSARSGRGFFGSLRSAFGALARWSTFAGSMITSSQTTPGAHSTMSTLMA